MDYFSAFVCQKFILPLFLFLPSFLKVILLDMFCAFFQNFKDVVSECTLYRVIMVLLTVSPVLLTISVPWNRVVMTI